MFECLTKINWKKVGLFASGTLFGTAGIKALSSKDAKKFYTNCTAAVLRAKECVMDTVATVQENAEDIYAEAQQIMKKEQQKQRNGKLMLKLMRRKKQKKFPKILSKKLQNRIEH